MTESNIKKAWKNEYVQTGLMIVVIVAIVFGFWFGSQFLLNTRYPAMTVSSGSMCIPFGARCTGWTHPFERTLHTGDLIIIQGVKAEDIKAAPYPDGDIIIFRQPLSDMLIVHRAINKTTIGGQIYFTTKGDGNSVADYQPVPASNVYGKVIMRIPWLGHFTLFMQQSNGIYLVIALIAALVVFEFVVPELRGKKSEARPEKAETDAEQPKTL